MPENPIHAKRARIVKLLRDPKWKGHSVRGIARQAGTSPHLVRMVAKELGIEFPDELAVVTKWGTPTLMDTSKIGRRGTEVRMRRALGRIASILNQYRHLKALGPLRDAYRQVVAGEKSKKQKGA